VLGAGDACFPLDAVPVSTCEAAAPIRGTTDVEVIAEIITYADYIAFSERLRPAQFTEDEGLNCRWRNENLMLEVCWRSGFAATCSHALRPLATSLSREWKAPG